MSDPRTLITLAPTVINTTSRPGVPTSTNVIISSVSDPISTFNSTSSSPGDPTSAIISSSSSSTISNPNLAATSISTSTFLSTSILLPSISLTSDYFSPTTAILPSYQSISAISLTLISTDEITITPSPSTWAGSQTTITVSVVETAVLSSDTPQHAEFTHQTGAIIGIAIGGTFLLLLIILLLFLAFRHHSNGPYNSPIFAVSRNPSWHSPLEADDDDHYLAPYGPSTHDDGRFLGDHLSVEENGSAESAGANGGPLMTAFGGHPPLPPLAQILHNSRGPSISPNYPYDHGDLRPWWANTEPLNVNKRVDSHVSARSTGSGETPLLGGKTRRYSITEPRPAHKRSGRKNYPASPTGFALRRDSSLEYATQRIQEHQEKERQQDRADQTISQIILARLRRQSTSTTVKSSQSRSEESGSSRTRSHIYSPSLLNPPMIIPEYQGPTGSTNQRESEKLFSPGVTLPPLLSTDASSMVEGLLHPRLGMALAHSQQASSMSLRDHEDYSRPINGLVNNHIQSTTTFDTVELGEGGT